jgi:hypothetical protein
MPGRPDRCGGARCRLSRVDAFRLALGEWFHRALAPVCLAMFRQAFSEKLPAVLLDLAYGSGCNCDLRWIAARRSMSHGDDERQQQLGNEVAKPDRSGSRQTDLADGHEPSKAGEKYPERKEVHERSLASNGDRRPQIDEAGREVHARHEAMNVVEPRRGVWLSQDHLQCATDQSDGCDQEQADLDDALAGRHRFQGGSSGLALSTRGDGLPVESSIVRYQRQRFVVIATQRDPDKVARLEPPAHPRFSAGGDGPRRRGAESAAGADRADGDGRSGRREWFLVGLVAEADGLPATALGAYAHIASPPEALPGSTGSMARMREKILRKQQEAPAAAYLTPPAHRLTALRARGGAERGAEDEVHDRFGARCGHVDPVRRGQSA